MSGWSLVGDKFLNLYNIDMTRLGNRMVFYGYKNINFQTKKKKKCNIFLQNIDCGY